MIFAEDANGEILSMLAPIPRAAPTFAFLDPEGSELAWATVESIARHKRPPSKKIEQLILFPRDTGFVRTLPLARELSAVAAGKITLMFGHDRWKSIYEERRAGQLNPEGARTQHVQLYADGLRQLRELGWIQTQRRRIVVRNIDALRHRCS